MSAHEEILDRMTDAFFALDEDWRFTYLNERAERILDRAADDEEGREDLLGVSIWESIPEAVDTSFYEQYHEAMRTQRAVSFEERYDPLDAWFAVHVYPSETGLSIYFRDISDRKRLEADLRRRDEVFRHVYRAIADKSATFEEKVASLLDIGRDALDTDYAALARVEDDEYVFEVVRDSSGETRAGDTTPSSETNCERAVVTEETLVAGDIAEDAPDLANREEFTEQGIRCYVGTPLRVDGQVYGTFCFYDEAARSEGFSDWQVTLVELMGNWVSYERERERRESELSRQRDRLDEFAHVISHDLRNPLNVAAGRLSLVREDCDHEQFDAIEGALNRIEAIVDDTLTLARQGRTVSELESVSVPALAEECWQMVASDRAEVEVVDSIRIRADPDRLRQVFENLFRNAVEHGSTNSQQMADGTATDGEEGVSVRVGLLDGRGFYVEDDGPGIPEADRESIFKTGYTTSDDGTGFGLAIVAKIAEAHGWQVGVVDGTDGGARFEFENVEFA